MVSIFEKTLCVKCTKTGCIAMCYGCQQSFCTRHFIKHRLSLSIQVDDLYERCDLLQRDLNQTDFEQPLLSSIYTWEQNSILKIQDIAEQARNDVQQWIDKTKSNVQMTLNRITTELRSNAKSDNYTETEVDKWTKQLSDLRQLLEKPSNLSLVEDQTSSSFIREIKLIEQQEPSSPLPIPQTNHELTKPIQEHFVINYGPCRLSDNDCVATQSNYRAGLSKISGSNQYTSGKHSIQFLIEKKGKKNLFIGIHSSSQRISSYPTFDYSVHGWWNLDYVIINGESAGGNKNELIQAGDRITLTIDCDNRHIQLEHHRTQRLVRLPINLDECPLPWKLLIKLLTTGDCIRILK